MSQWHTRVRVSGLVIPAGAEVGITETHTDLQEGEIWLTWNGIPQVRGPRGLRHRHVHEIVLACDQRWGATLENLRIGDAVDLHSSHWQAAYIPAGATECILRHFPVPVDRPKAKKPHGCELLAFAGNTTTPVAVTVYGRIVTLVAPQAFDTVIQYRPIRPCLVVKVDPGAMDEAAGKQGWGLTLVDRIDPP